MQVFEELAADITSALGLNDIKAQSWRKGERNVVYALYHEKAAFFAKVFAFDGGAESLPAAERYVREKRILANRWPVGVPALAFAADRQRVLIMRAIEGRGFKHFNDRRRVPEALGLMAEWLAGFHAAAPVKAHDDTLWQAFSGHATIGVAETDPVRPLLEALPVGELVLSKGDVRMAKWKFAADGTYGLDFEDAAMRPKEFDMVGLIRAARHLSGIPAEQLAETIVQRYALVRRIDRAAETIDALTRLAGFPE